MYGELNSCKIIYIYIGFVSYFRYRILSRSKAPSQFAKASCLSIYSLGGAAFLLRGKPHKAPKIAKTP